MLEIENIRKFELINIKGYNLKYMEKNSIPTTYIYSANRAQVIANAEYPYIEAVVIYTTILDYFDTHLDSLEKELGNDYDELVQTMVPVGRDYLVSLCQYSLGDGISLNNIKILVDDIFNDYKAEYRYDLDSTVPSIPLAYLMLHLPKCKKSLAKQMKSCAQEAEIQYIKSMN